MSKFSERRDHEVDRPSERVNPASVPKPTPNNPNPHKEEKNPEPVRPSERPESREPQHLPPTPVPKPRADAPAAVHQRHPKPKPDFVESVPSEVAVPSQHAPTPAPPFVRPETGVTGNRSEPTSYSN